MDQYTFRLFVFCLLFLVLVVADALFTIFGVSRGARELNPLMDGLLQKGVLTFFVVKYLLSALCLVLLVVYRHVPTMTIVMALLAAIYSAIFIHHLLLYFT